MARGLRIVALLTLVTLLTVVTLVTHLNLVTLLTLVALITLIILITHLRQAGSCSWPLPDRRRSVRVVRVFRVY